MAMKKYLSLERLQEYDALLKQDYESKIADAVSGKANASHTHDDRYYTETEIDTKLAGKSDTSHNHDSAYDEKGAASAALQSAQAYTQALEQAVTEGNISAYQAENAIKATKDAKGNVIDTYYASTTYADNAATNAAVAVKNELLNGAGGAYDTLKELGDLIDENVDAIEALEAVASGKANATHTHALADVTNLTTELDNINSRTIDQIRLIDFSYGEPIITIAEDGAIIWDMAVGINEGTCDFSATAYFPIAAGNNISFKSDGNNVVISADIEEITSAEIQALFSNT